jgi:MSHA biogenesis protein MshK
MPMRSAACAVSLLLTAAASARAGEPLPDPTRPPVEALPASPAPEAVAPSRLELRAIFHADDRRLALLDDRRVAVGDRIGDATVIAIESDRVRLRKGGEIVEIELVSSAFKNARQTLPPSPEDPAAGGAAASIVPPRGSP